jgi:hypothetical protein
MTPEFKMDYNSKKGNLWKNNFNQTGLTNYEYTIADAKGKIDNKTIDGNFYQTENEYTILVYYKESIDRYAAWLGGNANSVNIIN